MSDQNQIDWEKGTIQEPNQIDWDNGQISQPKEKKEKGFLGQAKDHAVSFFGKGTVGVGEVAVGLSNMMSDGATGKILSEKLGYDPKAAKNVMTGWQSEQYQQQLKDSANIGNRKIEEGDDFATQVGKKFDNAVDITKNAISNPSLITNTVAESLPSMFLGGVLGRASGIANPVVAGAVGEGAVMAGSQAEQIRQETVDGRLTADQSLAGAATGALGGLFGYAGGRLAQKMGLSDVDTAMQTGRLTTQQVGEEIAKTPMSAIPTAVIKGAISEGFLEELPQSVSEQILQNLALDKPWHDGVENAAVMGTLAGMAMGGTVSGAGKTGDWWNSRSDTGSQDSQQQSGSPNLPSAPPQLGSNPNSALTGEYIPRENVPQGANQGRTAFVYDQPSMEADNLLNNNYKSDADFDTSGNFDPSNNPDSPLSPSGGNYFEDHSTQPQLPSERLGINPDDGPMSAAAALAVDSGATTSMLNAPAVTDTAQDDVNNNAPLSSAAGLLNAPNENNSTITGTNANSNATYSTGNSVDGSNESSLRNDTNTPLDMLLGSSSETQAEAGTGTDMATQKVAEPILGADGKNKWFGSQEKAQAFLDKKNPGNDYQVAQDGKRFEIQPKSQVAQNQNDNLNNQNSILNTKNTIFNTENNIDKIQKISALEQRLANEKSVIKKVRLRKQITELQNGLDQNQVSANLDEPRKATAENLSGEFKRMEQATARVNAVRQRIREANPEIFTAENDRVRETHGLTNARVTSIADEIETSGNYELSDREYEKIKNNPNYKIDYDARNFMGKVTAVKDPHSGEWVGNNEQTDLNDAAVPVQDDAHFQSKLDQLDKQRAQFEAAGDYDNAEKLYNEMQVVSREWQISDTKTTETKQKSEYVKTESDKAWSDFYKTNRNMMVDDLFEGGHKDKSALENSPKEIQTRSAHGMAKSSPASAVADLKKLLTNGIDPNRGEGRLYTAPLNNVFENDEDRRAASMSGTSSGSSYADGAFTLVAKEGIGDIYSIDDVDAVMVNSSVPKAVVDGLRKDFPGMKIGYANELQGLLSGSKQSNNSQSKVADIESQHPVNKWQEEMNKALEKADPEHPLFKKLQASAKNGLRSVSDRAVALRQAREIEKKAEAPKTEQPKVKVSENKFVTDERRAELEKRIKAKLSQLNSGVDPELIVLGTELALYHIERGVRTFAAYAKAMTESLGDSSKPFLKSWYMGVKFDPRASGFDGMSSSAEVENFDVDGTLTNEGTMTGKTETVVTPAGREFEVRHKVVEASDLITSNLDSGAINAEYPQALQPRDRTTLKSVTQVNDIANKLNPKLLGDSASSTNGAPIVSPGNEVESGNGRTLAIRKAYQIGKADAYKAWLAEQGYDVDNMQQPVLVRERITPMNMAERVAYTTESNERDTLDMSPSEQAMSDAPKVMDILHLVQGGSFNNTANRDFVNAFLTGVASKNERGTMLDKDGVSLTQDGYRRIESALLAAAFNDAQIISQVIESKDSDIKAIGNALIEAAPQWAQVRKGVQDGILVEGVNVEANLVEAVHLVRKARQQNLSLSEMLNQDDIFDGSIDQVTKDFISIFYSGDKLNKARSSQKVADALKSYAQLAMTAKATPNLFGDAPLSNEQILGQVHEKLRQSEAEKQQDIFTSPQSNEPDAGTVGGGRSGRGTGPRSETAQEQSEPTKALKKTAPTSEKETIQDFGEKIGGARKDTSVKTGPKTSGTTTKDNRPTWAKRFEITEIAASSNPNEVGKWIITDTRKKDWKGNAKQLGKQFFDSQKDAELALPILAVAQKHRVWAAGKDSFSIYREISDRKRVKVVEQEFQTREDAMKYMAIHAIEILETNTTFGEIDLPRPEHTVRKGLDRRKGDAKDADFIRVFGFRGVEFGNWNNQAERQELLNDAFDGLMDLAEILNIPPAAISLNGELALAFGARGQGLSGAKAHYEPERAVINLTKLNGAGSLAHEWWHALDHYFGRQDGKAPSEWVTNADGSRSLKIAKHFEDMSVTSGFSYKSNVREDVQEAYKQLVQTIFRKSENYIDDTVKVESFVSSARNNLKDQLDKLRADLNRELDPKYYKRFNKAASAEQLAEFDTVAELLLTGTALTTEIRHNNNKNSRNIFSGARWSNDALDKLSVIYKSVRGRSGFNAEQKGVLDRLRQYMNTYAQRLKLLAEAQNGTEKAKMIPTDFAMNAKELDQGRGTDYWITTPEMTARAFQGYVEDKISQNSGYSPFLNFGPESAAIFTPWGFKRPFPTGTERKAINAKFSDLVDTLKTEETETGIKLYSRDKLKPDNERRGASPLDTTFTPLSVVSATRRVLSILQHLKMSATQDASSRGRINVSLNNRIGVNKVGNVNSNGFSVQVISSFSDLPKVIQNDATYKDENGKTQNYDVSGVWHDGTLYVVADQVYGDSNKQLTTFDVYEELLTHEIVGHFGVQKLFGNEYKTKFQQLFNALGKLEGIRKIAKDNGVDMNQFDNAYIKPFKNGVEEGYYDPLDAQQATVSELFAFVAQNAKSRPFVRQKLKEVIGYIRQWFRDRGFDKFLSRYNDADLMMFLSEARKAVVDRSYFGKYKNQEFSSKNNSDTPLYSRRTKSNSGSTTQQVRDVLIDRFGKETIDELERQGKLEIIQDYQVEGVEGFYYNGKAVLVASNLTAESTVPTFLHELGGHAGFQNMMNQKQYNELMNQFNKLVEQGNPVALAAKMLAEREQGSERQQLEYLPYLLTLSSTMQQRNVLQRNALQKLINNIVSYVKAWVFDNFGINLNLNPDDMLALSERMIGQIKHQSSLDLIRQKYHGTNQWMTAPNGAKTHLSEQQWLQVRTPEFKKWFGDWENDAANASQVLDENGEPKVVYHGTATEFNEFKQGHGLLGDGIYLTDSFDTADVYANIRGENGFVLPLFVNIRNVFKTTGNVSRDEFVEATTSGKYQGIVHQFENHEYIVALEPNQVKMAEGNKGTFNSESSDIRFSRSAKDIIDNLSKNLGNISISSVKDKTDYKKTDWLGIGLSALGRRQLTEIYGKVLPQLNKYNELAAQMDADKNDAGAEADSIVREWANLKDEDQLAGLMHDSTLAKIDPTKPYVSGDSISKYKQLRDAYNSLSPEAQAMYLKARDAYKKHYAKVHQAIKERILRSELSNQKKADLLKQMDNQFFGYTKGVYFPLARFGKYVVVMRNQNGDVESVSRAETMGEAQALRSELIQKFPHYKVNKVKLDKEYNKSRDAVGRGFMTSLFAEVDNLGLSTAERTEFEDTLSQLYLSSMPDLSWAKHGIHRKGTAGFSQDARRAFAQNMFSGANYLAKLRYGDQLAQQLDEMQKYADEQFEVDEDYDQRSAQSVITEMNKRHDNLMNPKGHPLSSALTSLGFIYYLGLSPAAAMVNLSQTALVAYPLMGAKWGFDKAADELLKASNDFRKGVEFHKVKWEGSKTDLYKTISSDISKFLNKDEKQAYEDAVARGVIDVTQAHDLAGIAQGEDSGVMWKTRPIMRAASIMFHSAERFNREVTFIAAYRLARQSGEKHDSAFDQAVDATYRGHFDYSSGNRPRIMQGNVAKVLLLFKQFGQNMLYTLARQTYQSIKGETEAERKEARKSLGAILAMHATFAGVLGLPMVGMLLSVASWMGGDDDEPWDAEVALRNYLAEAFNPTISNMLMKGAPRGIGVDISSRVGINNLLLPDVQEGLEGKKWWDSAASAALGPIGGIGANIAKGAQEISEGHNLRGVESMLPVFLKNFAKTYRYNDEGVQDKTGVSIIDEVDSMDMLIQGMGFSPSDIRTAYEGKSAVYQLNRKLNERRSRLMALWSRAKMMDDQQEMDEIWEEIQGFNDKNPSRRITRMNLNQSYRNRQRRIDRAEDGIYLSRNRQDAREAGYFAFGE
ncbi:PLxRFG domain-containing protein [Acinetobacter ursingii]|uniref:PLxRFG domain-containing protein n=1 Tax=Acinetobacter ursingii TaxID=108980 RepID=UPI0021E33887|nr:PLxRFG domain-containing protein [Acinetobacter ursingii]UYF80108.1 PLxRFG domain-containing protein [Acinetobacter ursingii]